MLRHALVVEEDLLPGPLLTRALQSAGIPFTLLPPTEAVRWARSHRPGLAVLGAPTSPAEDVGLALATAPEAWHVALLRLLPPVPARPPGLAVSGDVEARLPCSADELAEVVRRLAGKADERGRRGTKAEIDFRVRSDPTHLEELLERLARVFHDAGLSLLQAQQFSLAVRELGANSIEWGHGHDSNRLVTVRCRLEADRVVVHVRDTGPGFDPDNLPHAARAGDPLAHLAVREARHLREGGFGILMARGLADELTYNDRGNEARLVMRLATARRPRHAAALGTR
jgi:anti-sigma regulatory factor (Ser/Thr protein kinase)